jgi:hypothetical protein
VSLIPATTSLIGLPHFPARLPGIPCRFAGSQPEPADFNGFRVVSGFAAAIFPVTREFAASLAFATAQRQ